MPTTAYAGIYIHILDQDDEYHSNTFETGADHIPAFINSKNLYDTVFIKE